MKNPTYRDMLTWLNKLSPEQLDSNVTVYDLDQDEYIPVNSLYISTNTTNVLDGHHPILVINLVVDL